MSALSNIAPYLALIVAGFLPNEIWRWLGLMFASGLDENSQIVAWVRAVAIAILAGVIAKLILFSSGALTSVPISVRVAAALCGIAVFLAAKRSVFAGVVAGEIVLVAGAALAGM